MERLLSYLVVKQGRPVKIEVLGGDKKKVDASSINIEVMSDKDKNKIVKSLFPVIKKRFDKDTEFRRKLLKDIEKDVLKDFVFDNDLLMGDHN